MPDKPFKAFERKCAEIVGSTRYWANSGEQVDVESAEFVIQCKLLQNFSLQALTKLVEDTHALGKKKGKHGIVMIKCRKGHGNRSAILCVLTSDTWKAVNGDEALSG